MNDSNTISNGQPTTAEDQPRFIVGLGASAGGLEALQGFFSHMQTGANLGFVVVQHLSPEYKSMMAELLGKHSDLTMVTAEHGDIVKANHVYFTPPKCNVRIHGGKLELTEQDHRAQHILNFPIDTFFSSLAEDCRERAIAIVLSGTGSDGTRGIRAVKEHDGMVMVQDPATGKFDGMPRSAMNTGAPDFVLAPEQMPQQLLAFIDHPVVVRQYAEDQAVGSQHELTRILRRIRGQCDIDFAQYKPSTVIRRIERRMGVNQLNSLHDYEQFLSHDKDEVDQLCRELLIGVTKFFRDNEAFEIIKERVIPHMLDNLDNPRQIRVWIPGCSTGEEAYSLGILILEAIEQRELKNVEIRIFGTDVDKHAINFAANGTYPESIAADIDRHLLERYFIHENESYHVNRTLRERVVFAQHNLLKDPPFTKIDMVSCRNLLIYIDSNVQQKILSLLHFALKPTGALFLGSSETIGSMSEYFQTVSAKWKIYRTQGKSQPPMMSNLTLPSANERVGSLSLTGLRRSGSPNHENAMRVMLEQLIEKCAPECLVVDSSHRVIHSFGDVHRWLKQPGGAFTSDMLELLPKDLSIAVATAMRRCAKDQQPVSYKDLNATIAEQQLKVSIRVEPLSQIGHGDDLIAIFFDAQDRKASAPAAETFEVNERSTERISELEEELQHTRENLQATIEELETSNEELQATNEELLAANEELQSTNEELHSVNEELYTVNAEYQMKIGELTEVQSDLDNLLTSLDVGVIVLNKDLTIRRFNGEATRAFSIREHDLERQITELSMSFEYPQFVTDIKRVLENHEMIIQRVPSREEQAVHFDLKILPYRDADGMVAGVTLMISQRPTPAS